MARRAVPLLALLLALAAAGASARLAPEASSPLRGLLQAPDCSRVDPHCTSCENRRVGLVTQIVCTACSKLGDTTGYRLNAESGKCDCAPGYTRADAALDCDPCGTNSFCVGGSTGGKNDCDATAGATTTFIQTASRVDQCVTVAGYGIDKDTGTAYACADHFFSVGGNRNPCRACPGGLKTATGGLHTSPSNCQAPPGYYFDKSQAKPCPRGTYKAGLNTNLACDVCPTGTTTLAATTSGTPNIAVTQCNLAKRGYYSNSGTFEKCPVDTFQDTEAVSPVVSACTACPTGLRTNAKLGSKSKAACAADPGYGWDDTRGSALACGDGWYKVGFNRRDCRSCGIDYKSSGTRTSFSQCYIQQGQGTVRFTNATDTYWQAITCPADSYGVPQATFGIKNLPCMPCPDGTYTNGATGRYLPEHCVTRPGYGWDQGTQTAKKCLPGYWAAGGDLSECSYCGDGLTTITTNGVAISAAACVIDAGWGWHASLNIPEACSTGFFGEAGTLLAPHPTCTACSATTTTAKDTLATAATDCNLCAPGYGTLDTQTNTCGLCAANSYSIGDSAADCTLCSTVGTNFQSPAGATVATDCVAPWTPLGPGLDTIVVGTTQAEGVFLDATSNDAAACQAACDTAAASCMLYTFNATAASGSRCFLVKKLATNDDCDVMFKNGATKYTAWPWIFATTFGVDVTPSAWTGLTGPTSAAKCAAECDELDGCVAALWKTGGTTYTDCKLVAASPDPDVKGCAYRAVGAQMVAW